jgi:short-subunit dehydrogenase
MGVNVGGIVNSLVSFLPRMLERRLPSHIVNIGSMASYLSGPVAGVYTASKFAVRGITECLHYSLHSKGIGVSLVCPGLTKTNIHEAELYRPKELADAGAPATPQSVENIRRILGAGIDPAIVAEHVLSAIKKDKSLVFSHPGYEGDFEQIFRDSRAALPDDTPTEGQLFADKAFRESRTRALAGA